MLALLFGLLFFVGAAGGSGLISPHLLDDLSLGAPPPPCVASGSARDSMQMDDKGRASELSLRGTMVCEHQLFDQGERDVFYNFVVRQTDLQAKALAQALYDQRRETPAFRLPIYLKVNGANAGVEAIVRAGFTEEMVHLLGTGAVARLLDASVPTTLTIDVQRVDASDLLFQSTLDYSDADGAPHRRNL